MWFQKVQPIFFHRKQKVFVYPPRSWLSKGLCINTKIDWARFCVSTNVYVDSLGVQCTGMISEIVSYDCVPFIDCSCRRPWLWEGVSRSETYVVLPLIQGDPLGFYKIPTPPISRYLTNLPSAGCSSIVRVDDLLRPSTNLCPIMMSVDLSTGTARVCMRLRVCVWLLCSCQSVRPSVWVGVSRVRFT